MCNIAWRTVAWGIAVPGRWCAFMLAMQNLDVVTSMLGISGCYSIYERQLGRIVYLTNCTPRIRLSLRNMVGSPLKDLAL